MTTCSTFDSGFLSAPQGTSSRVGSQGSSEEPPAPETPVHAGVTICDSGRVSGVAPGSCRDVVHVAPPWGRRGLTGPDWTGATDRHLNPASTVREEGEPDLDGSFCGWHAPCTWACSRDRSPLTDGRAPEESRRPGRTMKDEECPSPSLRDDPGAVRGLTTDRGKTRTPPHSDTHRTR